MDPADLQTDHTADENELSMEDEIGNIIDGANQDGTPETPDVPDTPETPPEPDLPPEPDFEPLNAPDRWDPRFKDAFSALGSWKPGDPMPENFNPRDVAQAWLDFHTDRQAYITPLEQERARYQQELEAWNQTVAPYQQTWAMAGMTPSQGVSQLLAWGGALNADPAGTIQKIAQSVGVDLNEMVTRNQEWQDPQVKALEDRVQQLTSHLVRSQEQAIRDSQQQQSTAIEQHIATFRDATDEQGNLKHPHYPTLENTMAGLYQAAAMQVQSGQRQSMPTLDELYEAASWSHPEVREAIMAAERDQEASRQAQVARKAVSASRTVKSKAAGSDKEPAKSMEEEIGDIFDSMAE